METNGIYANGSSSAVITGSTISSSGNYGLRFDSGTPVITGNSIGNGLYLNSNTAR